MEQAAQRLQDQLQLSILQGHALHGAPDGPGKSTPLAVINSSFGSSSCGPSFVGSRFPLIALSNLPMSWKLSCVPILPGFCLFLNSLL